MVAAEPRQDTPWLSLLSKLVELGHPDVNSVVITKMIKLARLIYHLAHNKGLFS